MKLVILLTVAIVQLAAVQPTELYGEWESESTTMVKSAVNTEYEQLTLNPGSFMLTMFVTVRQNDYLIKDLQIQGIGEWKVSGKVLVYVIREVRTIDVQEIKGISQDSLNTFAAELHQKFLSDPIRILSISSISSERITTINEAGIETNYRRR
ncbi:MAG: hypothetical protein U9Q90_07820 [Campylobacterota bacterium]|nr:hypothetical protein [Campylobacterota bacterium]